MSVLTKYQEAALEYNKHISLTANAGSGKTTVLSKRYVEILTKEKVSLNNIVAITFTEKAASELYSKIAKELEERIKKSNGWRKTKLENLRRNLVSAKISTIHSFCIDILKDFAPEAGIDASFSPIDSRTADELLEQSIDEVINNSLRSEDDALIKKLIRLFGNKTSLANKIKLLYNKRKTVEYIVENQINLSDDEINNQLEEKFEKNFNELFDQKIQQLIENIKIINSSAGDFKQTENQSKIEYLLNEIETKNKPIEKFIILNEIKNNLLTGSGTVRKVSYLSKTLYEELAENIEITNSIYKEFKPIVIDDNYKELNRDLSLFNKSIIEIYFNVREKYELKKRQKSYLDFEDLLIYTQKLLTNENVKNTLSEKYKYIMVDEYQDTNEIQYKIFMPILKNLTTGNLFVVGDEKQSIYMFREAEVRVFDETKKLIADKESLESILDLPHSFRLAPNIALFTNVLFSKLFQNPNPKFNEVNYNELICAYPHKQEGEIEFLVANEEQNEPENELVSKRVKELVESEKYKYGDFAILCKKRKNFIELEKVFAKYNIPFSIVGGKGFYQQQLVLDVYNYLSFLINPSNDLALTSILRGPYFNLSDIQLAEISFENEASFFNKLKSYSSKYSEVQKVVNTLERHINLVLKTEISELLRIINVETGYWIYLSSKQNGKQELANLEKLIQKSVSITEQGFHTLYDFIQYLKDAINNLEDEGQADLDETENSVKIMTIHQAKGLEFKVVVLYKTNQKNFDETLKSKEISIDKEFGILAKLPLGENYFEDYNQAPVVGLYNYIQNKKAIAELKRLLYVAITRAEEHLIISLDNTKEKLWQNSFASMIIETLKIQLYEDHLSVEGKLTKMKLDNGNFVNTIIDRKFDVKIIHSIEQNFEIENIDKNIFSDNLEVNVNKIAATEKNEIISASKISLFLHCPKKYQLTYEFGYGQIIKLFGNITNLEFNDKEEEETVSGNIVGSIAHEILEQHVSSENLHTEINKLIEQEEEVLLYSKRKKEILSEELFTIINGYYLSDSFNKIKSLNHFKNELEIYKREKDYYLYGIIDKLIIEENKLVIIDYKSDKINETTIEEKTETYFNQLLFYSYVLTNNYPQIDNIELWLVFLRDDSYTSIKKVNKKQIIEFGKIINKAVNDIRNKNFNKDTQGCKDMKYYLLDEC